MTTPAVSGRAATLPGMTTKREPEHFRRDESPYWTTDGETLGDPGRGYELLTRQEAAAALRIHISTLTELTVSGKLDTVRIGRRVLIPVAELQRFIRHGDSDPIRRGDRGAIPGGTPSMFNDGAGDDGRR